MTDPPDIGQPHDEQPDTDDCIHIEKSDIDLGQVGRSHQPMLVDQQSCYGQAPQQKDGA